MDQLSRILSQYSIGTGVFYSGRFCGLSSHGGQEAQTGHIHLLRKGKLTILEPGKPDVILNEPTLIFFPRPALHIMKSGLIEMAQVVCAEVHYGVGPDNPLANSLPDVIYLPLSKAHRVKNAAEWLFEEAFSKHAGKQLVIDRLCELLTIELLRHVLSNDTISSGLLAGLSHDKLSKTLEALHERPSHSWSLQEMAEIATMSRARFALQFRTVIGQTPGDYLAGLRVDLAKQFLKQDKPVSWIANELGYENASGFTRTFKKKTGISPREWRAEYL